ncbi:hypothetical protein HELRODRAFT_160434 [Helobdella robusta]|uniref:Uncharacterized protein n=1 Tax=Helobdella robusta TaxID=6412 RepID=T1EQ89_HELRO|nr:hypothetical protein HELRODRAFT_160434 [Helobdella robusta]ESO06273.1 hypothetical protein HELRODRAFT_160434 [Helobdella robusta]
MSYSIASPLIFVPDILLMSSTMFESSSSTPVQPAEKDKHAASYVMDEDEDSYVKRGMRNLRLGKRFRPYRTSDLDDDYLSDGEYIIEDKRGMGMLRLGRSDEKRAMNRLRLG